VNLNDLSLSCYACSLATKSAADDWRHCHSRRRRSSTLAASRASLLAEIEYRTKSAEGKVRHPFFKGIREDL
jgi:ATP-dependent DNA ligase